MKRLHHLRCKILLAKGWGELITIYRPILKTSHIQLIYTTYLYNIPPKFVSGGEWFGEYIYKYVYKFVQPTYK